MTDRDDRTRRPARPPLRAATRRRWLVAGAASGLWLLLYVGTSSMILASMLLVLLTLLAGACVVLLRPLGVDGDHPWVQRLAERPWRDGRDVLQQGLRVPFNAHDGRTWGEGVRAAPAPAAADLVTVAEAPPIPPLRLVTNGSMVETRRSGAHAGRGAGSELVLPAEPTVSRVHAKFVFTGGQWWITSLGRNGITLNGVPVAGERAVSDGDCILWGSQPGALMSRVRIG